MCRREYLRSLRDYLLGFLQRTQPLQDSAAQVAKADEQFEADWAAGAVPGWADAGKGGPPATAAAGALDVDAFDSVEELVQLGEGARLPPAGTRHNPGSGCCNIARPVCTAPCSRLLHLLVHRCQFCMEPSIGVFLRLLASSPRVSAPASQAPSG